MRRLVITILIVAIVASAGWFAYQRFLAPQPEAEAPVADANSLAVATTANVVSAEGEIVPLAYTTLSFQSGGEIAEILAAPGDSVRTGDPLLRLQAANLEIAVQRAEADLVQAEANLAAAEAGVLAAQAGLTAAENGVDAAAVRLALIKAEPLPQEVALSESNVAIASAGIEQAAADRDLRLQDPTQAQIRAAEAQLAAAIAARQPIEAGYGQLQWYGVEGDPAEQAAIQLNAAQAQVNAAQTALNELNEGATPAEQQAANAAVAAAVARRDAAQARLDLMLAGPKPEQVALAEVHLAQAQAAIAEAELAIALAEAAVAQAEAGVVLARTSLESAQAALDRMTLKAPFDGRVGDFALEVGEVASPGVPVVTVADVSAWLVETTDLTELDVVAISAGLAAEVQVDAIPGEVIGGVVTDIDRVSTLTRGDVTYAVTIRLDEDASALPLRWGMTAFVDVNVD